MKKYVDRGGIMKQLNKRSVLFFKRVVSSTFFSVVGLRSENTVAQIKRCSVLSSFIIPHLFCSRRANCFIKSYLHKNAFEVVVPAFHKS